MQTDIFFCLNGRCREHRPHTSPSSSSQHSAADRRKLVSKDKSYTDALTYIFKKRCRVLLVLVIMLRGRNGRVSDCHINAKWVLPLGAWSEHTPSIQESSQINDYRRQVFEESGGGKRLMKLNLCPLIFPPFCRPIVCLLWRERAHVS